MSSDVRARPVATNTFGAGFAALSGFGSTRATTLSREQTLRVETNATRVLTDECAPILTRGA
jgi:hypothetical protein